MFLLLLLSKISKNPFLFRASSEDDRCKVGRVEFEEHGRVVPRRKGLLSLFFYIYMVDKVVKGCSLRRSCLVSTPACQSGAYLRGESRRLIFHVRQWLPVSTMGMDRACKRQTKREIFPSLVYEERERERHLSRDSIMLF